MLKFYFWKMQNFNWNLTLTIFWQIKLCCCITDCNFFCKIKVNFQPKKPWQRKQSLCTNYALQTGNVQYTVLFINQSRTWSKNLHPFKWMYYCINIILDWCSILLKQIKPTYCSSSSLTLSSRDKERLKQWEVWVGLCQKLLSECVFFFSLLWVLAAPPHHHIVYSTTCIPWQAVVTSDDI